MDLVALVAACALAVDPKLMHALIWHQSGGEPWSFSVPGERQPQVYRSAREAVHEAQAALPASILIRVGLTGLTAHPTTATAAMFTPCLNISMAARQITQLVDRCKAVPSFKVDPVHCAIAAYRGSWDHPDNKFADAVTTTRRTSTWRTAPVCDRVNWCLRPSALVSTLPRRPQVLLTISSEAGRVHCFRRG